MKNYFCIAKIMASALTVGVMAQAPAAFAQDAAAGSNGYPNRPIRLIVSQQAGGSSHTVARLWAELAGKAIGGSIVMVGIAFAVAMFVRKKVREEEKRPPR